jgi:hypothetical protein
VSADNGFTILPLDDRPEYWGIFYYQGDGDFTTALSIDAREVIANPITAILKAHKMQKQERTEYGVYVSDECLSAALLTMADYLSGEVSE